MAKPRLIDLFSGAGGLTTGLEAAGFEGVFASEINPVYAQTYALNHPGAEVLTQDIRETDASAVRERLGLAPGELELMAGGPPCQGFSINAPVRSGKDPRNHLFAEYLRFVDEFRPKAALVENVPGLVSFKRGGTLRAVLEAFGNLGYGAGVRVLSASYYGVPQMRWRAIVIAVRGGAAEDSMWPTPRNQAPVRANFTSTLDGRSIVSQPPEDASPAYTTVRDAIGDLPSLRNGERGAAVKPYPGEPQTAYQELMRRGSSGVTSHEAARLSKINLERMAYIKPGGNWTDIPYELLPEGMKRARKSDHTKRYGRLTWDGLASTVLTKCDPHWGAFFHPEQDRSLTVREAARIQSFPDAYRFKGALAEQYAEVGNAVPPLLAQAVGERLIELVG